jgi:hypothetical protein
MAQTQYYLTLDQAIERFEKLKTSKGTGDTSCVHLSGKRGLFAPLLIELTRGGANDVFKEVSRAGQPVVVARPADAVCPVFTVDSVLERLQQFKTEAGSGTIPFLADGWDKNFQLCDIVASKAGANNVLKSVSRGGQTVFGIALLAPDDL